MKKRILSLALALGLCLSLMPAASAAETLSEMPDVFQGDGVYITATPFSIQVDDGWYVNTTGYSNLAFGDGLIMVVRNEREVDENGYYTGATIYRAGFADKTGRVVLDFADWENPPALRDLLTGNRSFSEGLCAYYDHETGLYGYLNTQGEPVTPAIYDYVNDFRDGVAWVRLPGSDRLQVINTSGQVLFEVEREDNCVYSDFGDGLAPYRGYSVDGEYFEGYIDKQGHIGIDLTDTGLSSYHEGTYFLFSDGYAVLEDYRGSKSYPSYVIIDTQGSEVATIDPAAPVYAEIAGETFYDGLLQVSLIDTSVWNNDRMALVNIRGEQVYTAPSRVEDGFRPDAVYYSGHGVFISTMPYAIYDIRGGTVIPDAETLQKLLGGTTPSYMFLPTFADGLNLLWGTGVPTCVLEVHEGTYTGSGMVYDALTGTIRDGGGSTAPVDPEPTTDQPSSWAAEQVSAAVSAGLVPENLQAKYTQTATRAEFCALAVELYEKVTGSEITQRATFSDTTDVNVQKMAGIGVISGIGNNQFDPNGKLTREQAATILVLLADALGQPLPEGTASFADNSSISSWALESVGRAKAGGIMDGTGSNRFSPQGAYTREQSIMTAYRLFETMQ